MEGGSLRNNSVTVTKRTSTQKNTIIHSQSFEKKHFFEETHRHYGMGACANIDYPFDLIATILSLYGMTSNSNILMSTNG